MLSNITSKNRVEITANWELGKSLQELHNIEIDRYPPITHQLDNLNDRFNT